MTITIQIETITGDQTMPISETMCKCCGATLRTENTIVVDTWNIDKFVVCSKCWDEFGWAGCGVPMDVYQKRNAWTKSEYGRRGGRAIREKANAGDVSAVIQLRHLMADLRDEAWLRFPEKNRRVHEC